MQHHARMFLVQARLLVAPHPSGPSGSPIVRPALVRVEESTRARDRIHLGLHSRTPLCGEVAVRVCPHRRGPGLD